MSEPQMIVGLEPKWRDALSLNGRDAPEFYTSAPEMLDAPHSEAIRFALEELKLAAVFCIEGVPTIGFLDRTNATVESIDIIHRILWNQGLMSLLLVVGEDELSAYSLVRRPIQSDATEGPDPRLVSTLSLLSDAVKLRELIRSTESGRFWFDNEEFFEPDDRVDSVLLSNLQSSFRTLRTDLGDEPSQALLMQTMFIAYLEDRDILSEEVFSMASEGSCTSFASLLESGSLTYMNMLFDWLKGAFNGNLFNAPCTFEEESDPPHMLAESHLRVLATFRHGRVDMVSGQLRFWGYEFRHMPISLISAVYDKFLNSATESRRFDGAYYTPMFLADVAIDQLWGELTENQRANGLFYDPACGSGIFLVRLFQRLVAHHCHTQGKQFASWHDLKAIASRLHGGDINSIAVRVAAFSLYIAMLERSNPPDLTGLIKAGKLLPGLYGNTLQPDTDVFSRSDTPKYDAIIGNPPWKGRSGQVTTAERWTALHQLPFPEKDIAWGFVWKALRLVKPGGLIAFLLPAMGLLHNTSKSSQTARRMLLRESRVIRIINFSDLCFQLFDGAQRPTAFILYEAVRQLQSPYRLGYWVPKADLNLRLKRIITLAKTDRISLRSDLAVEDPTLFKRRLWSRGPDEKLLQYLQTIPPISDFISEYRNTKDLDRSADWVIGQGFIPAQVQRSQDEEYKTRRSDTVSQFPYFDVKAFRILGLPMIEESYWPDSVVYRRGFEEGFIGPHILIPQGVERSTGRVRASYTEQSLVFRHTIQAIVVPESEKQLAKLLTAVFNSSLAAWFYFHDSANLAVDRSKVHQGELLNLPFSAPANMPNPDRAFAARDAILELMDQEVENAKRTLMVQSDVLERMDNLVLDYYDLSNSESTIVREASEYIFPAVQPRRSSGMQKIWTNSHYHHRAAYAESICEALQPFFSQQVSAILTAKSRDAAILKLSLGTSVCAYREETFVDVEEHLDSISTNLKTHLSGNIQTFPDLRFVIDADMYLVKPMQLRHWLCSTALADAEQILAEFTAAVNREG